MNLSKWRMRVAEIKKKEFNAFSIKAVEYYIYATGAIAKDFCIALAKVISRTAEILRGLLKEEEVK